MRLTSAKGFIYPNIQPNIVVDGEPGQVPSSTFNPSSEPAVVPGVGNLDYPGENSAKTEAENALSSTPGYTFGDYLSGRAAANKEDLFNYFRDLDLQERAEAFNSAEAAKQREFEKEMSSSAYQRAAADLQAAGFNPAALVSQYATQASTPGGSSASISGGHVSSTSASGIAGILGAAIGAVAGVIGKKIISGSMNKYWYR